MPGQGQSKIVVKLSLKGNTNTFLTAAADRWYHLQKKVKDLMTIIAENKALKIEYISELNQLLWIGDTVQALDKLRNYPVKNTERQHELIGYLEKNSPYIIDYKR